MVPYSLERSNEGAQAMVSLREAVSDSVRDFMCRATEPTAQFAAWLDGAISAIPGNNLGGLPGAEISQNIRGLVCPGPGGGSGGGGAGATYPPQAYTPGQCELEPYLFEWEYTQASGTRTNQTIDALYGPIGDFRITTLSNGNLRVAIECRGVFGLGIEPPGYVRTLLSNVTNEDVDPQIISLTLRNGGEDNCGDPLPQQPPTGTDTIDYDDPDGNPVVGAPITFTPTFPIVLPGGELVIPFEVCILAICLDLDFNLSTGDITFKFGGQEGGEVCCPPVEVLPPEDDADAPPPPDSEERYWGVKINFDASNSKFPTVKQQPGSQTPIYLPDVCLVRFAVELGGLRAWTPAQKVQTNPQFVPVNVPATAYAYDLFTRPGISVQVKPVIVKSATENP